MSEKKLYDAWKEIYCEPISSKKKFHFREWSANNRFVYSVVSMIPWHIFYSLIRSLNETEYNIVLGMSLLGFQLLGLVMLIISVTVWKKYRNW